MFHVRNRLAPYMAYNSYKSLFLNVAVRVPVDIESTSNNSKLPNSWMRKKISGFWLYSSLFSSKVATYSVSQKVAPKSLCNIFSRVKDISVKFCNLLPIYIHVSLPIFIDLLFIKTALIFLGVLIVVVTLLPTMTGLCSLPNLSPLSYNKSQISS